MATSLSSSKNKKQEQINRKVKELESKIHKIQAEADKDFESHLKFVMQFDFTERRPTTKDWEKLCNSVDIQMKYKQEIIELYRQLAEELKKEVSSR